jgi:DNA-binding MarR family transcriptional regulator
MNKKSRDEKSWTFLTNHGHVLMCLSEDSEIRLLDVAERIGITERAAHKIVSDLEEAGIIKRHREGRRNRYTIHGDEPLRHPLEEHCTVGQLIHLVINHPKKPMD